METAETTQLLVRIPTDLHRAFRMKLLEEGLSMRQRVQELLESEVKDYQPRLRH